MFTAWIGTEMSTGVSVGTDRCHDHARKSGWRCGIGMMMIMMLPLPLSACHVKH